MPPWPSSPRPGYMRVRRWLQAGRGAGEVKDCGWGCCVACDDDRSLAACRVEIDRTGEGCLRLGIEISQAPAPVLIGIVIIPWFFNSPVRMQSWRQRLRPLPRASASRATSFWQTGPYHDLVGRPANVRRTARANSQYASCLADMRGNGVLQRRNCCVMDPACERGIQMLLNSTEEQVAACDVFASGDELALIAGAGAGKTTTLEMMGRAASKRKRGIYMTFNRATADDARSRFPRNVECSTAHSLAWRATGQEFKDRLS